MKKLFAVAVVSLMFAVAGCSTPGSAGGMHSGAVLQSDGTYTSSGSSRCTTCKGQKIIDERIADAKDFCELTNKKFRLIKENHSDGNVLDSSVPYGIIYFACE